VEGDDQRVSNVVSVGARRDARERRGACLVPDLLNTAGSVASVVSAIGAAWFWLRARTEARTAVRLVCEAQRRQLVDDLTRLGDTLDVIETALAHGETGAARHLGGRLVAETVALSARHAPRAPENLRQCLLGARRYAKELASGLATPGEFAGERGGAVQSLINSCRNELAGARGHAQAAVNHIDAEGA